jgi:hypothetical protein
MKKTLGLGLLVALLPLAIAPCLWAQDPATPTEEEHYELMESQANGLEQFDGGSVGFFLLGSKTALSIIGTGLLALLVVLYPFAAASD